MSARKSAIQSGGADAAGAAFGAGVGGGDHAERLGNSSDGNGLMLEIERLFT
jgi:hypothetical protein